MKQKYVVLLNNESNQLVIQEYAELDKEMLSLLCEETYDLETIKTAAQKGRTALVQSLRTHNMYPPGSYTEEIADNILDMLAPGGNTSAELFFEEKEMFTAVEEETTAEEDENEDDDSSLDVDELLEEDIEDDFEDKGIPKDLKKTIKISNGDSNMDES
ncbi:hypothetical protein Dvar_81460 [Desulfosarcina variabilis str. Montpellier]|uniref:hypothetical protein n=1 Tax=Desulfosarcina variabilis TaxID=2300 RepID=UPI003AFA1643